MFFALLTAHLVTDFALQPDWMASAKRHNFGVLALHAAISGLGVMVVAWLYWPQLRGPALVLAIVHLVVDWTKLRLDARLKGGALAKFVIDQLVHVLAIAGVLIAFGLASWSDLIVRLPILKADRDPLLAYAFAYSTSIFFGYVLLKVIMADRSSDGPKDAWGGGRYLGMLERGLITTCVALGQFLLIAAVFAPRLVLQGSLVRERNVQRHLRLEMIVNLILALGAGLWLR